jgi:hypothetical protein
MRTVTGYPLTDDCHVMQWSRGRFQDQWCSTHAAYLVDCLFCGRWFHTARPDTRYCSNACRQAAYRERLKIGATPEVRA